MGRVDSPRIVHFIEALAIGGDGAADRPWARFRGLLDQLHAPAVDPFIVPPGDGGGDRELRPRANGERGIAERLIAVARQVDRRREGTTLAANEPEVLIVAAEEFFAVAGDGEDVSAQSPEFEFDFGGVRQRPSIRLYVSVLDQKVTAGWLAESTAMSR